MIEQKIKKYRFSKMGNESSLPALSQEINVQNTTKAFIRDYEGLFIGFGKRQNCYPYREQNLYTDETESDVPVIILENDCLYAEFLPALGGRLWKLINKKTGEDLLYHNDVIRFRNLSVRNAWFSGGVEWNIGIIGHTPYTCESLYAAKVTGKNGEEVLRFYEYERVRGVYYQMDFMLDEDKLIARMCIYNPSEKTVPMYWWSNIATPEFEGGRVIVPADSAYNNSDGTGIAKSSIPFDRGVDVSYPERIPNTIDYFYDIPDENKKFIANVDKNGKGLLQYSTKRLKGRKLFSWGHIQGSKHWQELLTDKAGDYVEIQAGLGKTQYECIPMPPNTTWSWTECYTGVQLDNPVDSDYAVLVSDIDAKVNTEKLEKINLYMAENVAFEKGEMIWHGHGWGYLNNLIHKNAPEHLEFLPCVQTQKWVDFINTGKLKSEPTADSFLIGDDMYTALKAYENQNSTEWQFYYQLGLIDYDFGRFDRAMENTVKSMLLDSNYQNNHLYMSLLKNNGDKNYLYYAKKIVRMKADDYSVVESIFKTFLEVENFSELIDCYEIISEELKENARIKMYLAVAYLNSGFAEKAEKILLANGGIQVSDYREGDKMLNKLYRGIREKLYGEDPKGVFVPFELDFVVSGI